MTDPNETLSAIDAAIEGWAGYDDTVSSDAMRWAPEPPKTERRGPVPRGTVSMRASDGTWTGIGYTTDDGVELGDLDGVEGNPVVWRTRPVSQTFTLTPEQVEVFRHFTDHVKRQHDAMRRAMQTMAKGVLKMAARAHASTAPITYGDDYRRHRRSCRACNPRGNPKPLKANGADYTRRRKNRRRRA